MIASRVVVVAEVVAELAFRMNLPGIYNVDVSAFFLSTFSDHFSNVDGGLKDGLAIS